MQITDWQAAASATLVGSMPHRDRSRIIDYMLAQVSEVPVWPQLSGYPNEQMMVQYLEGLPGIHREQDRTWIETAGNEFDQELYDFYNDYLSLEENPGSIKTSRFAMGEETGRTFLQFIDALSSNPSPRALKGQITGPFTLLSGLKDRDGKSSLYDDRLLELIPMHLVMKARWQIAHLERFMKPIIIFMDEPALAGFGSSAFISISAQLVHDLLATVAKGIQDAGAMAGVHICANTDWNLAFESSVDIINFDAYNYLDKFLLYSEPLRTFLDNKGIVAWGMVPTSDSPQIEQETAASLYDRWRGPVEAICDPEIDIERIARQSLFTPSCGCGTLSEARAEAVVRLTTQLSTRVREQLDIQV